MASARLTSYVLALEQSTEVICAYSSQPIKIFASPTPMWQAIGAFITPRSVPAFLQVLGWSTSGAVTDVRLFGPTGLLTSNCRLVALPGTDPVFSQHFNLTAGQLYHICVLVTGTVSAGHFGVILSAALSPRGTNV